jgi:HEAT repeat protein
MPAAAVRLTLLCVVVALAGCQDGPVPENRVINPWARQQWEEDEKFGPTYYKRMDELAAVRGRAPKLAPADQERLAKEIAQVYGEEPSPAMRSELIRTLAYLPTADAQEAIVAALNDADHDVRIAACQGLARIGNEESLAALAKTVEKDGNLDVRLAAVHGLSRYKDAAAQQALGRALEDNDPAVQKVAMESLKTSTGRDYGNSVPAWKEYLAGGNPARPPGPSLAERFGWPWY